MDEETFSSQAPPNEIELEEYYFETDPLALQNDPDYQKLLRTLVKLESQRIQAVKDLEKIQGVREQALKDPLVFVKELLNGGFRDLPGPQEIEPIPQIDMEKYNIGALIQDIKPKTRKKNKVTTEESDDEEKETDNGEKILVRGREYTQEKPLTFNQPWTDEEQRRLDEALIEYPEENFKNASQRYAKISKVLGMIIYYILHK